MKLHVNIRKILLPSLLFMASIISGVAQDCALDLQEAQNLFDQGKVELVAEKIESCLVNGRFTREEELAAYKLLIQSLMLDDKPADAEDVMIDFLRVNPEYSVGAADYSGFVYLRSKFIVKPVFMISFQAGISQPFITSAIPQSVSSTEPDIRYNREPFNFFAGTEAGLPVSDIITVNAGLLYSAVSFGYSENMMGFGTVNYREVQRRIEVPVSLLFNIKQHRSVGLFARAGTGMTINLYSDAKASFTPSDINNGFNRTGENVNRVDSRIAADMFIMAGIGGRIKVPGGYINAEITAMTGLFNQSVKSSPDDLEYYYFHTDDKYRLGRVGFSAGYTHLFHKPLKISDI